MQTKREVAKELLLKGKEKEALKYVAKFPFKKSEILGQKIQNAWDCWSNLAFYKQMNKNTDAIIDEGIEALKAFLQVK